MAAAVINQRLMPFHGTAPCRSRLDMLIVDSRRLFLAATPLLPGRISDTRLISLPGALLFNAITALQVPGYARSGRALFRARLL